MRTLCLHGAESTGKSTLAQKLGLPWVPEYGRAWSEANGTEFALADLLAIAEGQARETEAAIARLAPGTPLLVLDTDQLMTAVWARMLFDVVPPALLAYPRADHYLLFEADVPWREDGTRQFGSHERRARFAAFAEDVLVEAGVSFTRISGSWADREAQVRDAVARLLESA